MRISVWWKCEIDSSQNLKRFLKTLNTGGVKKFDKIWDVECISEKWISFCFNNLTNSNSNDLKFYLTANVETTWNSIFNIFIFRNAIHLKRKEV